MAATSLAPIVYQLSEGLRNVDLRSFNGFDLHHFFGSIDIKIVGLIALAVIAILIFVDLFGKPYGGYGKSLAVSAANAWEDNRDQWTFDEAGRGSRSLEPMVQVLDTLAGAVQKWDGNPQEKTAQNKVL
ncbi:hypothetical protein SK128_013379 [Halocaridina rubra]|uniref:Uncharacterized protein n=1 Tax=Halocaridina rubra TaxID=373956 RepID=A0AAN8XLY3_HALRR